MRLNSATERKKIILRFGLAFILLLLIGSFYLYYSGQKESELLAPPVVKELNNNMVGIVWETADPEVGALFYQKAGAHELEARESEETTYHNIILSGLDPNTEYSFRLSEGSQETFFFTTPPPQDQAFRFLVLHREGFLETSWSEKLIELSNTQMPDFVLAIGEGKPADYIRNEREFLKTLNEQTFGLPVYLIPGSATLSVGDNRGRYVKPEGTTDYFFDFGNARFIVLGPKTEHDGVSLGQREEWLQDVLASAAGLKHSFVILTHDQGEGMGNSIKPVLEKLIKEEQIGAVLNVYTQDQAWIAKEEQIYNIKDGFMVVDVDVEGVTAKIGDYQGSELMDIVIKDFPEAVKRSCVYCRKLLEKAQYEDSIQWYRDFIDDFGDDYMVDDSQFEIANIYDRYLYDYENAIKEYQILVTNYDYSNKVRQARQRIEYLQARADFNFGPLQAFEKAKMETFVQKPVLAIEEVEKILAQYPGCNLEPELLDWLGRNLASMDFQRSVYYLEKIVEGNYSAVYTENAQVAIGDTLYANAKYKEAIAVFEQVMTEENQAGLASKLYRCYRNIRREIIKWIAIGLTVLLAATAIFSKPFFFTKREFKLAGILAIIYLFVGALCWKIYFTYYPLLILLVLALAIVGALVPMMIAAIYRKLLVVRVQPGWRKVLLTGLTTVLFSLSVIYLTIYIYRVHYLVAFRL